MRLYGDSEREVGDSMEQIEKIKVLFVAGFGPIVREKTEIGRASCRERV